MWVPCDRIDKGEDADNPIEWKDDGYESSTPLLDDYVDELNKEEAQRAKRRTWCAFCGIMIYTVTHCKKHMWGEKWNKGQKKPATTTTRCPRRKREEATRAAKGWAPLVERNPLRQPPPGPILDAPEFEQTDGQRPENSRARGDRERAAAKEKEKEKEASTVDEDIEVVEEPEENAATARQKKGRGKKSKK